MVRNRGQERRHGAVGRQVRRRDPVEQRAQHAAPDRRHAEPDREPDHYGGQTLPHDHPEHGIGAGAERDPDAQLAGALHHAVRDHPVDAERS